MIGLGLSLSPAAIRVGARPPDGYAFVTANGQFVTTGGANRVVVKVS